MRKIFLILLFFFIFWNVSAKCDWVAYFSVVSHYYNTKWDFCKPWESVAQFQALDQNKNFVIHNWDGSEYSFLADLVQTNEKNNIARVVLDWKTILEFPFYSDSWAIFSRYSLSIRYIFSTFRVGENEAKLSDLDKDIVGFYINGKMLENVDISYNYKIYIFKKYWFLPNDEWFDFLEIERNKMDYFVEKYRKLPKEMKQEIKENLRKEIYNYIDEAWNFDYKKYENKRKYYRKFAIYNYLLQEIVISEILLK